MTGAELKAVRANLGLSQSALAVRLDKTRQSVVNYEKGATPISPAVENAVMSLGVESVAVVTPVQALVAPALMDRAPKLPKVKVSTQAPVVEVKAQAAQLVRTLGGKHIGFDRTTGEPIYAKPLEQKKGKA